MLAREARLPVWALASDELRFPAAQLARLWQVSAARRRHLFAGGI